MWNLPVPPGFRGLNPHGPVSVHVRNLPHWRQEGATYFVTFRQADSLPQQKLQELAAFRQEWKARNPLPWGEEQWQQLTHETMRRVEYWLDQGMGSCRLRDEATAKMAADAMHHFDGDQYEL